MRNNSNIEALLALSNSIKSYDDKEILNDIEDDLVEEFVVTKIDKLTKIYRKYLQLTTIPWVINSKPRTRLELIWDMNGCKLCESVLHRKVVPYGNMHPRFIVIGDAPSSASLRYHENYARMWSDGKSSKYLKKVLHKAGIYNDCWFTNLICCTTSKINRLSTRKECSQCSKFLTAQIKLLKPEIAILLGNHVTEMFEEMNYSKLIDSVSIRHPSYSVRFEKDVDLDVKIITKKVERMK